MSIGMKLLVPMDSSIGRIPRCVLGMESGNNNIWHLELAAKLGGFQGCTLGGEVAEVQEGGQL